MFLHFERKHWSQFPLIAGIDEAGRGAWAGPVVAAAVIFKKDVVIAGVDDSKKLSPQKREELFGQITKQCLSYGIGIIGSNVIDGINILEATKKAMLLAVAQLLPQPNLLLIDDFLDGCRWLGASADPIFDTIKIDLTVLFCGIVGAQHLQKTTIARKLFVCCHNTVHRFFLGTMS